MKLSQLLVAGAALVSASAIAGGNQAKQGAQSDQQTQQSSQAAQGSQSQQQGSQQQASQSPEIIKRAQEKLSAQGHDAGQADGKLGAKTQAALKGFQQSKGLQASGQLDTQTLAALDISGTQALGLHRFVSGRVRRFGIDRPALHGRTVLIARAIVVRFLVRRIRTRARGRAEHARAAEREVEILGGPYWVARSGERAGSPLFYAAARFARSYAHAL